MSVDLSEDQIFSKFPYNEATETYIDTVPNPFVYCNDCTFFPCPCSEEGPVERYYCSLCDHDDMTRSAAKHHMSEPSHFDRMEEAKVERSKIVDMVARWRNIYDSPRLKRLKGEDSVLLPDRVLAAAYRYIKTEFDTQDAGSHTIDKAADLLLQYENLERLSLLDLAVWKAECLSQMPVVDSYLAAKDWMSSGWKESKAEQRKSGAMNTVVSLVLPFLKN